MPLCPALTCPRRQCPSWWCRKARGEAIDKIIANFEAANPDIDIQGEYVGNYNDIVANLQAAIPAKRAPDAVVLEVIRYGLFAEGGVLADLTPYFEADPLKDERYDYAREIGVISGKTYIVPFNSSTPVLCYNKDIFARAGTVGEPVLKTFYDILAASRTITEKLGAEGITGIAAPGQAMALGTAEVAATMKAFAEETRAEEARLKR